MNKFISRAFIALVVAVLAILSAMSPRIALTQTSTTAAPEMTAAKAQISGSGIAGTLNLRQKPKGYVTVDAVLQGDPKILTPGLHGFHIHEIGTCEQNTSTPFSSAKGHFDPGPFGSSVPVEANHPYHLGDLPNILVDENGRGILRTITSRFSLSSSPVTLFDRDGSAVILHKLPDEYKAGGTATEAGGGRLACGVIEVARGGILP